MRICSPQLGISPTSGLGGTVHDREILGRLAALGVQVEMPLPKGSLHERVDGWHIHWVPRHLFYTYEYNWLFVPSLFRLWRSPGFDLLRVHSPSISLVAWTFKRVTGVPVVAHHHHLEDRALDRLLTRVMVSASDKVITVSDYSRRQLVAVYGLPSDKVAVVYNGVAEAYAPSPERGAKRRGDLMLFYLGSLKSRKNLRFLLEVYARVRQEEPGVRLTIGGRGPQGDELVAYADGLGLADSVAFLGYVPELEKVARYNEADIFVLPSRLEGFGMVVTEAMACGKPVVASNVCSLPELVDDGETGFLADPWRVDDFVAKILRLVRDRDLREQMGIKGREKVLRRFSWDEAARRAKQVYEEAIAGRPLADGIARSETGQSGETGQSRETG